MTADIKQLAETDFQGSIIRLSSLMLEGAQPRSLCAPVQPVFAVSLLQALRKPDKHPDHSNRVCRVLGMREGSGVPGEVGMESRPLLRYKADVREKQKLQLCMKVSTHSEQRDVLSTVLQKCSGPVLQLHPDQPQRSSLTSEALVKTALSD